MRRAPTSYAIFCPILKVRALGPVTIGIARTTEIVAFEGMSKCRALTGARWIKAVVA
jgi:hypothetical protein